MIQHPPGTPPLSISCSNFSLSALDVMLSSLYLSLGFKGIKFATQKLNFSASEDDGLSPALATSSANLEWLFPTAMALDQQYKQSCNNSLLYKSKRGFWQAHITGAQDWQQLCHDRCSVCAASRAELLELHSQQNATLNIRAAVFGASLFQAIRWRFCTQPADKIDGRLNVSNTAMKSTQTRTTS